MARFNSDEREKNLATTRAKLLDSAVQEFSNKGFESANINNISETAGLGKGTVYNYFPSKRGLMLAAIKEVSANHRDTIRGRVQAEVGGLARLEAFYSSGFDFVIAHPARAHFMIGTMYGSDQEFKQAIYLEYHWMAELIREEILEYGRQQGLFSEVDPAIATGLLMTLYLGSVAVVDEDGRPFMRPGDVFAFSARALQSGK